MKIDLLNRLVAEEDEEAHSVRSLQSAMKG